MSDRNPISEQELYEALVSLAGRESGEHPGRETLGAFAYGELAASEQEQVELHLAACRECTDLVLELRGLGVENEPGAGLAPEALTAEVDAVVARAFPPAPLAARRRPASGLVLGLAAAFFLAAVGLGLWALSLASESSRLKAALEPQPGAAVVDLYPASFLLRGEEGPQHIHLPREARWATVLLTPPASTPPFATYRLVVGDASGKPLWQGAVEPGESGSFALLLPSRLARGEVRFRLLGAREGAESLIEEYRVVFEEP